MEKEINRGRQALSKAEVQWRQKMYIYKQSREVPQK